jgi:hypothetical protein
MADDTEIPANPALATPEVCALDAKDAFDNFREAAKAAGLIDRWVGDWNLYYAAITARRIGEITSTRKAIRERKSGCASIWRARFSATS